MISLLDYSGIRTKTKALEGKLLSPHDFDSLAHAASVPEAVEFLRGRPGYGGIFANLESAYLHRDMIERLLNRSLYRDFEKLYKFATRRQRDFLDYYFLYLEISILKKFMRALAGRQNAPVDPGGDHAFFNRHSSLDLKRVAACTSLDELAQYLATTRFGAMLEGLLGKEGLTLFDYEMQLDRYFFTSFWKRKWAKSLPLTKCNGTKLDLLNLQWIYRSKKYYALDNAQIVSLLIPDTYRLKKGEISALVEAQGTTEFFDALRKTAYGKLLERTQDEGGHTDIERLYEQVLNRVYEQTEKEQPYSLATLNSYLYFKELEIRKIVTTVEGIRYGLGPDEIGSYVIKL
ncbi:MAG: V-type ATPase subunit [Lachnospiraceae bacterium]|jgi:V/A-type H+-transporting ATPase subunit C|nr:V-type ATPase subunit [Lachnospiraceae bacterium]